MDRFRRPYCRIEYTGANRCTLCTVVNPLIAATSILEERLDEWSSSVGPNAVQPDGALRSVENSFRGSPLCNGVQALSTVRNDLLPRGIACRMDTEDDAEESDEQDQQTGRNEADASSESAPVAVGDGREKHVSVLTRAGERHDHGDVYLKQSSMAFFVSSDESFSDAATTRYPKEALTRVEVIQHHSACFITTATAGEGPALDALREFRDDSLSRSSPGRALVSVYEGVSPPIATTLARHPEAATTRLVRWLVRRCSALARRRKRSSPAVRTALTVVLVALYVFGVGCAALGHCVIRLRERD